MQRFTISLDDDLAEQFDALIARKGYVNRSEAVRDLIRLQMNDDVFAQSAGVAANIESDAKSAGKAQAAPWCVANVSYVYDHHDQTATGRILNLQHEHHDLVVTSVHTHLDHDNCLETVVIRGPMAAVRACAEQLMALRGVRHGGVHVIPLETDGGTHRHGHSHTHPHDDIAPPHRHHRPRN